MDHAERGEPTHPRQADRAGLSTADDLADFQESIVNAHKVIAPFNPMAAYQREREYSRKIEATLSNALTLLGVECGRREMRGEDVSHIRTFIKDALS